jgi:hypothetical protein
MSICYVFTPPLDLERNADALKARGIDIVRDVKGDFFGLADEDDNFLVLERGMDRFGFDEAGNLRLREVASLGGHFVGATQRHRNNVGHILAEVAQVAGCTVRSEAMDEDDPSLTAADLRAMNGEGRS